MNDAYELVKEMRDKRITFRKIGEYLGFSGQRAQQIFKRGYLIPKEPSPVDKNLTGRDRTREWVRVRDNHTCQICFKKWMPDSRKFDVHHLNGLCGKKSKDYDKVSEMDGLVTLCHKCHMNLESVKSKMLKANRIACG